MAEHNVATVESLYEAWSFEGLPGLVRFLDPDIEYVNPGGAVEPGTRTGLDAFLAAAESTQQSWVSWRMFPERLVAIGDSVAVVVRYEARARSSGIAVEGRESALLTLRAGKIVRYEWFHGPDDALRAAERNEPPSRRDR